MDIDVTLSAVMESHPTQIFSMSMKADGHLNHGEVSTPQQTVLVHIYCNFPDIDLRNTCHQEIKQVIVGAFKEKCDKNLPE